MSLFQNSAPKTYENFNDILEGYAVTSGIVPTYVNKDINASFHNSTSNINTPGSGAGSRSSSPDVSEGSKQSTNSVGSNKKLPPGTSTGRKRVRGIKGKRKTSQGTASETHVYPPGKKTSDRHGLAREGSGTDEDPWALGQNQLAQMHVVKIKRSTFMKRKSSFSSKNSLTQTPTGAAKSAEELDKQHTVSVAIEGNQVQPELPLRTTESLGIDVAAGEEVPVDSEKPIVQTSPSGALDVTASKVNALYPDYIPPAYGAYPPLQEEPVKDNYDYDSYLWLSIIVCLCCNPLLGVWAIGYSVMSHSSKLEGNEEAAKKQAQSALKINVTVLLLGASLMIIVLIIFSTGALDKVLGINEKENRYSYK